MRHLILICALASTGCGQSVDLRPNPQDPILTASTCAPPPSTASVACYGAAEMRARMDVGAPGNHEVECVWTCAKKNDEYGRWTIIFRPGADGCYVEAEALREDCPS